MSKLITIENTPRQKSVTPPLDNYCLSDGGALADGNLVVGYYYVLLPPHSSYLDSCSLDLLFFFLFSLFLVTRKALLSAVEGAVEKAVIPRIADRVEDSRHHRANEQRLFYFLLSFCPSTKSPSTPASAISTAQYL